MRPSGRPVREGHDHWLQFVTLVGQDVLDELVMPRREDVAGDPQAALKVPEIANVAAFVASHRAGAITGAVANLTGGMIID